MTATRKGDITGTVVRNNIIEFWFQSPDGDSSDTQILNLRCASHNQATNIANRYNEMFNIDFRHTVSD